MTMKYFKWSIWATEATSNLTFGISYLPLTAAQTKILNSSLGGQTKVSKYFNECRKMHMNRQKIYLHEIVKKQYI